MVVCDLKHAAYCKARPRYNYYVTDVVFVQLHLCAINHNLHTELCWICGSSLYTVRTSFACVVTCMLTRRRHTHTHVDVQIGLGKAFLLLVLYFLFVLMVLAADIWHRIRYDPDVTLPPCAVFQTMLAAHVMTSGNAICCRHVAPRPIIRHRSIWLWYMVSCETSNGVINAMSYFWHQLFVNDAVSVDWPCSATSLAVPETHLNGFCGCECGDIALF